MEKDPIETANQFIQLWQENFAKTMQDPEIMSQLTKTMGFMQQFYGQQQNNQSTSAAANVAFEPSTDELFRQQILRKLDAIEERIAKLERKPNRAGGKKKTS